MSLRFFHIFFVAMSMLLAFGCAYLAYSNYRADAGARGDLWVAIVASLIGLGSIIYAVYFLRKTRDLNP